MKKTGTVLAILFLITSCVPYPSRVREAADGRGWHCPPLPQAFKESDLIGTWQSKHGDWATDTITLREDGTYQQIYHNHLTDYYYKSSWNRWRLEHRSSGGIYLHLERMRYCLSTDEMCRQEGGGGGDGLYYDSCEGHTIRTMTDKVILVVSGAEGLRLPGVGSVPQDIILWYPRDDADTSDSFFVLQEPSGQATP